MSRGGGAGDEHILRVYPPGSSNSRARHSSSASPVPAKGPPGLPPVLRAGGRVLGDPSPRALAPSEALSLHPASRARGRDRGSGRPGCGLPRLMAERVAPEACRTHRGKG